MIPNEAMIRRLAEGKDSFYLYDENTITLRMERLRSLFPEVEFLYSMKCNSNRHVSECIFRNGFGADAASSGEVLMAHSMGVGKEDIMYSVPGKSVHDIEETIDKSIIIADSIGEMELIEALAEREGRVIGIGVRVNPDFSFNGGAPTPSKFGVDEPDLVRILEDGTFPHLSVVGIHVHLKSQELDAGILSRYHENVLALVRRIQSVNPVEMGFVNMGSGIGIDYRESDEPMDLDVLSERLRDSVSTFRQSFPGMRIIIETGRFITGKAGVYVTKVADRKVSRGRTFVILNNTLNGFVRPSLARMVAHYSPEESPGMMEPLFTAVDAFQFIPLRDADEMEVVDLVGNLCTASDVIAEGVSMPVLGRGDIVVITNAGAYASVLSPKQFSSQRSIGEFFLRADGETVLE